jgi:hypothetical protein
VNSEIIVANHENLGPLGKARWPRGSLSRPRGVRVSPQVAVRPELVCTSTTRGFEAEQLHTTFGTSVCDVQAIRRDTATPLILPINCSTYHG